MRPAPPSPQIGWAWFLDIDGTVVSIASTPDDVVVDREMLQLIKALHVETGGALALVSGRAIQDVDILFPGIRTAVAGQHGAERRDAVGHISQRVQRTDILQSLGNELAALEQRHPGLLLEDKGLSLALHYRLVPQLGAFVRQSIEELLMRVGDGFHMQIGKCVVEIVAAGNNKGTAVDEFMAEPPFRGRMPVFLGDDVTDEHAFLTINELKGYSIKVGPGSSNARYHLPDVTAVHEWLATLPFPFPHQHVIGERGE